MTSNWHDALPRPVYSNFKKISVSEEWFEVYEIKPDLFVFYEPRHCEEATCFMDPEKRRIKKT